MKKILTLLILTTIMVTACSSTNTTSNIQNPDVPRPENGSSSGGSIPAPLPDFNAN